MSEQVVTALVSGLVALAVAGVGAALTLAQQRRERARWLTDLKSGWAIELHKARLDSYPEVFRVLGRLSHGSGAQVTPALAGEVALELNDWFYGPGGMCATATTRGAVLGLRSRCRRWAEDGGRRPGDLYAWRDLAVASLRRDVDLPGLESYDFSPGSTMLDALRRELESTEQRGRSGRRRAAVGRAGTPGGPPAR
ncbi:hypothetical protein [Kitasatospora sp. NBC_00458]|uniref:hypothetical protein n=1 Tax=Kitasatospora sp. NBC_00458 TaxID=2903568 RepID=UPI002E19C523